MCVIVHCWVQAAHLLRSLAFQIKDDVNDPVWLFVLQFVLQFPWILKGAFGLKHCCLWSRLNCLTGWEIKIYLHICEALWVLSHTVNLNFSLHAADSTPTEEKWHILSFCSSFFQCCTHWQYKIVTQLVLCLFGLFYLFRLPLHTIAQTATPPSFPARPQRGLSLIWPLTQWTPWMDNSALQRGPMTIAKACSWST